MELTEHQHGSATVLDINGRFDFASRREFKEAMDRLQQAGCHHVILNLEKVSFVDSSALGLLVVAHQNLKLKEGRISLVNPQSYVRQILDLANVPRMIPVFSSVEEACSGFDQSVAVAH
jgi:anti-anti-sigma factor